MVETTIKLKRNFNSLVSKLSSRRKLLRTRFETTLQISRLFLAHLTEMCSYIVVQ